MALARNSEDAGIMSEAVGAFKDFCFNNFQLRRLYAAPLANNPASARVLDKTEKTISSKTASSLIHSSTKAELAGAEYAQSLSHGVTVHHTCLAVDLVLTLLRAKD